MNELIDKVNNLCSVLDEQEEVKKIKLINKEIVKRQDLLDDISLYNKTMDNNVKERIINNKLFREYKHQETEINLIIMHINQKLKELNDGKGGCL